MKKIPSPPGGEASPPLCAASLETAFRRCADFQARRLSVGAETELFICWIDGLISSFETAEELLRPLCDPRRLGGADAEGVFAALLDGAVSAPSLDERKTLNELCEDLTHGRCALVCDALGRAISFDLRGASARAVGEPTLEKSLKGSRDSFVETLRANTALVRRHLATPQLKLAERTLGRRSHTRVALLFLEGAAKPETVSALARRLESIDPDALVSLGALEEALSEKPLSPFPQLLHTEKPDRLARWLLDGRVALLVDGLPIALALPVSFAEFMKVTGDGSMNGLVVSLLTALRYLALVLGMYLPALYAAVAAFHPEMPHAAAAVDHRGEKGRALFDGGGARGHAGGLRAAAGGRPAAAEPGGRHGVDHRRADRRAGGGGGAAGLADRDHRRGRVGHRLLYDALALVSCLIAAHLSSIDSFGQNYTAPLSGRAGGGVLKLLFLPPRPGDRRRI